MPATRLDLLDLVSDAIWGIPTSPIGGKGYNFEINQDPIKVPRLMLN